MTNVCSICSSVVSHPKPAARERDLAKLHTDRLKSLAERNVGAAAAWVPSSEFPEPGQPSLKHAVLLARLAVATKR
eukprot:4309873-Pleurochrysis_carterae.AAC.3